VADAPNPTPEIAVAGVTYAQLTTEHPERIYWKGAWLNYRLLYEGGKKMLDSAGQSATQGRTDAVGLSSPVAGLLQQNKIPRRFLYQLEGEPTVKYNARWERAFYIGYIGAIIDYFRHWLFSQPPEIRPCIEDAEVDANDDPRPPEVPDWWEDFFNDCTGSGKGLIDFLRDVFLDVLVCQRAGWLIGSPSADVGSMTQGDAEDAGVDGVVLTPYTAEEIVDWQHNDAGELDWVVLRKQHDIREFPGVRKRTEVYTHVDRNEWHAWEVNPEKVLTDLGGAVHGLGKVPFVWLQIPEGLWPANKLFSWQVDLFNKSNMLSHGQLMSMFLQPVITSSEEGASGRIFGEGTVVQLRSGGKDRDAEKFEWVGADSAPLEFNALQIKEQRDEGYRIVHQMSLAVDSQAVGAIARSGVSKVEDRRASEVILAGYGTYVRDAIIRTANLISKIQGDDTEFECVGFDNFAVSSLEEELQTAALMQTFDLGSPTFDKTLKKNLANRVLGHIDEATRTVIEEEIDAGVEQQSEQDAFEQDAGNAQTVAAVQQAQDPKVEPGQGGAPPQPPKAKPPVPPGPAQKMPPFKKAG
jgi:hypothetical protein